MNQIPLDQIPLNPFHDFLELIETKQAYTGRNRTRSSISAITSSKSIPWSSIPKGVHPQLSSSPSTLLLTLDPHSSTLTLTFAEYRVQNLGSEKGSRFFHFTPKNYISLFMGWPTYLFPKVLLFIIHDGFLKITHICASFKFS
jgi:hypothetical protein